MGEEGGCIVSQNAVMGLIVILNHNFNVIVADLPFH